PSTALAQQLLRESQVLGPIHVDRGERVVEPDQLDPHTELGRGPSDGSFGREAAEEEAEQRREAEAAHHPPWAFSIPLDLSPDLQRTPRPRRREREKVRAGESPTAEADIGPAARREAPPYRRFVHDAGGDVGVRRGRSGEKG